MTQVLNLGSTIQGLRKERKLTQTDLAGKSQIKPSYLSQIEAGKKTPAFDVMDRIAFALDIPIGHLIMKAGLEREFEAGKKLLYKELSPYFRRMEDLINDIYN